MTQVTKGEDIIHELMKESNHMWIQPIQNIYYKPEPHSFDASELVLKFGKE